MSEYAVKQMDVRPTRELPFVIRALWFVFLGLELTAGWIFVAWLFNLTIIGLPVGLWMIDRVPQILTLKSRGGSYVYSQGQRMKFVGRRQTNFLIRALYFVLIGWWFSFLWAVTAYLLCATVIGLPLGALMLNTLPFVTTLHQN